MLGVSAPVARSATKIRATHNFGKILVIKIGNVIIGIALVALRGKICNAQVVEAGEEDQNSNYQDWDRPIRSPFADVSCQEEGTDDDEKGADQEEDGGQRNRLVGDLRGALLELQVNVALICAGKLGVFHFAAGDRSGEICPGRHLSRQEGSAPKDWE